MPDSDHHQLRRREASTAEKVNTKDAHVPAPERRLFQAPWRVRRAAATRGPFLMVGDVASRRIDTRSNRSIDGFVPDPYRLLDAVEDAIVVVDENLAFSYLNFAARFVLGGSKPTPAAKLIGMSGMDIIHPADRDTVANAMGDVLAYSGARIFTRFRVSHSQHWKPVAAIATNLLDDPDIRGIVVCFRDLETEEDTERLAANLESAIENSSTLVVIHAADGSVTFANAAATSFFGLHDATPGWPYPPHMSAVLCAAAARTGSGENWEGDIDVRDHNDDVQSLLIGLTVERGDNATVESIAVSGRNITDRKNMERDLAFQAFNDPLTGLSNRAALLTFIGDLLKEADGVTGSLAVLHMDLDRFKAINDSLGHAAGDAILVEVSRRLRAIVRPSDLLARLASDEFVLVLPGHDDDDVLAHAHAVGSRIRAALEDPIDVDGTPLYVSASIGIAVDAPPHETIGGVTDTIEQTTPENLLRHADLAMDQAKLAGRSRTRHFHPDLANDAERTLRIASALHKAIDEGELRVAYQPIANTVEGTIRGFEALVRWRQPDGELLPPDQFLDIAEQSDLIERIDTFVMERACADLARWSVALPQARELTMSVNLSARQLGRIDLAEVVQRALTRTGIAPNRLVLEITESNLMEDLDATKVSLEHLRRMGVQVAIDDFGTGYSSLSYLQVFGADILKIDRSFVASATESNASAAVVRAVTLLAATFSMAVVAEGVETVAQRDLLRDMGCGAVQGFLIAEPVSADDARTLIMAS